MAVLRPRSENMRNVVSSAGTSYRAQVKHSPRATIASAWRYSVFVKFMKGALPLAAIGLGALVLTYVMQTRDSNKVALTFEQVGQVDNDLTMAKPELTGVGDDGAPFKITAASAVQDGPASDVVRLQDVVADVGLKDGIVLHITAPKGTADTKTHQLEVAGGIYLTSKDGYEARTKSASADLKAGIIRGQKPIEATGKFGHVTARRFALDQNTRQLRFSGNVRMLLNRVPPKP